jgi:phosphonate degradation associated HDIG domain protein
MDIVQTLCEIYATKGFETFEGDRRVSQTSHGLQTAMIAEAEGADDKMIVACLLHDIGRIINPKDRALTDSGKDAKHEIVAQKYLEPWFGPEVTMPILWHVAAKRYLVATDPAYSHKISPGSTRSLKGQGGLYTEAEAAAFLEQPFAAEGVLLRRWDDRAKLPDAKTPAFEYYVPHIERSLKA